MNIDINELKQKTATAIATAVEKSNQKTKESIEASKRRVVAIQRKANRIIEDIPDKCATAAEKRESSAIVMKLTYSDYEIRQNNFSKIECTDLKGAAALVWEACVNANLKPTLDYWWSGDGMDSGFNLTVHWD